MLRRQRIPLIDALSAAAPALAIGHAIGRIGCFLVGDDYGRPTSLPWGVAFPEGLPPTDLQVHPTQLYETAGLGIIAWLLIRWRRQRVASIAVFGRYLILAGSVRFLIEFVRVNRQIAGPFTLAQLIALALVGLGVAMIFSRRASMERDVICGMQVDPAKAAGKSEYNGRTFYFCSMACKRKFDAEPAKYASK
jgi:phosphatidylglycerol---prolipoprotein diacylglyceryl transferase